MKRRTFIEQAALFSASLVGTQLFSQSTSNWIEPVQAASITELNFGIISTESQANQRPLWEPFIAALSKSIGIPVKAFYATQYAGVIEAMRFGKVQVAWYGGKSYIEAARIANAEVFAQVVNADGTKGYYSYLIANKDNPITAAAKKQGGDKYVVKNASKLTFAFNEPNSTSGFLVPSYYVFAKNKIDPKKAFKRLIFAGNHEATALAVANKQVDVATNNSEALDRLEKTNPTARKKIDIIWTSPVIPSDPIAYRKDLPEDVKKKLRSFFYSYKDRQILAPFNWSGFVAAQDKTWNGIRELDIAKKVLDLQAQESLSDADKKKLNDLNNQLRALQGR
ncbi:phosphonate ABC transporter substrate-binding protein [Tolypothrix sp. PCC 7910]|uniref:phosphonate ABC transporter substrate-binding protein n=1 Tax=Tolypothrix sp. PCC 7910 TaxID=2099387 RepID=UPI0014279D13|nr:phosphonate ABC transporter substrate-binding protein [Tolypothrix sp. PCC 7910]QIR36038.1 phosphonate ABC transporter substrate-binding protein [Tolypothrix sp. PCC 7910]